MNSLEYIKSTLESENLSIDDIDFVLGKTYKAVNNDYNNIVGSYHIIDKADFIAHAENVSLDSDDGYAGIRLVGQGWWLENVTGSTDLDWNPHWAFHVVPTQESANGSTLTADEFFKFYD